MGDGSVAFVETECADNVIAIDTNRRNDRWETETWQGH
jgi:hypothetical protein